MLYTFLVVEVDYFYVSKYSAASNPIWKRSSAINNATT